MIAAQLLDLRRQYRHLDSPSANAPQIVEVPPLDFLMIDRHGGPNPSIDYQRAAFESMDRRYLFYPLRQA